MLDKILKELELPQSDKSLEQAKKVKALMGPVTAFWFDRIVPYIEQNKPQFLDVVFKFAKKECEAAVHKDDDSQLFAVKCIENNFDVDKTLAEFNLPDDVKSALTGLGKVNIATNDIAVRVGKWTRRRLMPLIKQYKHYTADEFLKEVKAIANRMRIDVKPAGINIDPVDNAREFDTYDFDDEPMPKRQTINAAGVFEPVDDNTYIVVEGNIDDVAECFHYPKSAKAALVRPRGMLTKLIRRFFVRLSKDTLDKDKVRQLAQSNRVTVWYATQDQLDVMSFSSVNRPVSIAVFKDKSKRRHDVEYLLNPFAHFTELKRSTHTMIFTHPVCTQDRQPVRLMLNLNGRIVPEIPLLQATTLFLPKDDPNADAFLHYITGLPVSLDGDGFVVSKHWESTVHVPGFDMQHNVYKLQAPGRAKGIKIAAFDKCFAPFNNQWLQIDVIQNTQGKRKNKLASIAASCLRLLKHFGENIPVIDIDNVDVTLIQNVLDKCKTRIEFVFNGKRHVVEGYVGIQKFMLDVSMDYNARIDSVAVDYAQAKVVERILGINVEHLHRKPENIELASRALKWLHALGDIADELLTHADFSVQNPVRIDKDMRIKKLYEFSPSLAEVCQAVIDRDIETLKVYTNCVISIPTIHGNIDLPSLKLLCSVDDNILPHDFAHALVSYALAFVDHISYPTEYTRKWLAVAVSKLFKSVASTFTKAMTQPRGVAIVGRHATGSHTNNVVYVPKYLYYKALRRAEAAGQIRDHTWIVLRHPVVGAMPKVSVRPANTDVIIVPKHLAKDIDGDDDGDIVSVFVI